MNILITGSPGFIGANLALRLLSDLETGIIVSADNMSDYYDPKLKEYRLRQIEEKANETSVTHIFEKGNIADKDFVEKIFSTYRFDIVIHLAAQAGVRYSIDHPDAYIESNIIGFFNILEACRKFPVTHLVAASSSSVYGESKHIPFCTDDKADRPVSLYAATKRCDELFAYSYAKLYCIPTTMLRFFTVYGPAGRPDMFYYLAAERLCRGEIIEIYNYGKMKRDFTYVDDIIEGIVRVMKKPPMSRIYEGEMADAFVPYAVYNIGGGSPENLLDFVRILQEELVYAGLLDDDYDFEKHRRFGEMRPGDVSVTFADTCAFERDFGYTPKTHLRTGLRNFVTWYKEYKCVSDITPD